MNLPKELTMAGYTKEKRGGLKPIQVEKELILMEH